MDELTKTNLIVNKNGISPSFQCNICLDLVMNPIECNSCSKLFCKECIESWLKSSKNHECPNKHTFSKKGKLDEWIQPALNRIFIKCPFKDAIMNMHIQHGLIILRYVPIKIEVLQY